MKIELTNEERQALLRIVEDAVEQSRYQLSPETEALRRIAEKLRGDEEPRRKR
jgi:hypothetical protein